MKVKSIITCGLLLLGIGAATTSCEDMFEAENNLVTTDLAPKDTIYQMMGIVQRMQKLAERTVLLGEVRADLLDVDKDHATAHLQGLYDNTPDKTQPYDPIKKEGNIYNQPADYYAVINSCNIYLAYVDSLQKTYGTYKYEREICATKCFRAWCYLELAKIYGEVPFVQHPILTTDAAEAIVTNPKNVLGMETIIDECINDLQKYPSMEKNNELRPSYSGKWNEISFGNFFIPVRALLAELYMWKGTCSGNPADYEKAVSMYHDFFCYPGEERNVGRYVSTWVAWDGDNFADRYSDAYLNRFDVSMTDENLAVIPCDTTAFYGNNNNISEIFNSLYRNNFYPAVMPSQRIKDISAAQKFIYYDYRSPSEIYIREGAEDVALYRSPLLKGDLRLSSVYGMSSYPSASKDNANLNTEWSGIFKWLNGKLSLPHWDKTSEQKTESETSYLQTYVPYFRIPILYLHMAEALNGAGFPETAYAVLRYGLAYETMADRSIISQDEFDDLCQIKSVCPRIAAQEEEKYRADKELNDQTKGSFVIWSSNVFARPDKRTSNNHSGSISVSSGKPQVGIHSFGSGDTEYDDKYYWLDDPNDAQMKADLEAIKSKSPISGTIMDVEIYETDDDSEAAEEGSEDINETGKIYAKVTYVTEEGIEVEEEFTEEAYNKLMEAYEVVNAEIRKYYREDVRPKRQARVAQLILEEEALEGMFEGHRFYDLMRYQMRNGSLGTTITMPAYITQQYGETSRMAGRPWFLQLPKR